MPARDGAMPGRSGAMRAGDGGGSGRRTLTLVAIGTAAGAFSSLFGVGGGVVIIPLLVARLGYGPREAAGTSLATIAFIAACGAVIYGLYGDVDVRDAVLVGGPAVAGVLGGTWLAQRVPTRLTAALFSLLLVATAVELVLQ